jgi:hypothetical protein
MKWQSSRNYSLGVPALWEEDRKAIMAVPSDMCPSDNNNLELVFILLS